MTPWKRNALVVWLANFVTAVGMSAFLPLFPFYLRDLGVEDESSVRLWTGIMVAAAPLPAAFLGPVWGALGDRLGRKAMMLRANIAIVIFVGLMGSVSSLWMLLALRLLQGCFSGFIAPAMTLVSVATPDNRQGSVSAWLQTAITGGSVIGPFLGGRMAEFGGLHSVFYMCAGASSVAVLLTVFFVREPEAASGGASRLGGSVAPLDLLRTALRDVLFFLRSPVLRGILLGVFGVRFAGSLVEPMLGLWVERLDGVDPARVEEATGDTFAVWALALLVAAPLWGRFGDRFGYRRLFAVCAAGGALFQIAPLFVDSLLGFQALRFGVGFLVAGLVPAAFAAAARASDASQRGGAYGVTFSSVIMARGLAPVCAGFLAAWFGLETLFVISALLMLFAGLSVARSRAVDPAVQAPPPSG